MWLVITIITLMIGQISPVILRDSSTGASFMMIQIRRTFSKLGLSAHLTILLSYLKYISK
jgi:hypothetical protein